MSLAGETRRAIEDHPFLVTALRAGVVNYTAAARFLEIDGETDAIATALRRYAEELPAYETRPRDARVRMESGIGPVDPADDTAFVSVAGAALGSGGDDLTAILATGDVDALALAGVLRRLALEEIEPITAGVSDDTLIVVVDRLKGANALRAVENALEKIPTPERTA
ncbi:hypothetical protein EA462_07170 [Natrarchaeobius halalkaliphilus]|uniref:Uncharacterized protein n=1 Tax=Natrarchaeobius halalkaliphilus TaxID=1679091 RepID=A0A3N6MWD8_9EURY|nr:hypothetical protein [Natrarchaeobius halalkaliphilus]RQG89792.1 hypothetical protein EA462_07170 [Natrarchaeobius halalkaliphilus]